jgi:hypothetical protein
MKLVGALFESDPNHPNALFLKSREDLEKVCLNLAANSPSASTASPAAPPSGGRAAPLPLAAASPVPYAPPRGSPGGGGGGGARGSGGGDGVADALLAAQLRVMTQKAAGFERQLRQAQAENEQLREQV